MIDEIKQAEENLSRGLRNLPLESRKDNYELILEELGIEGAD